MKNKGTHTIKSVRDGFKKGDFSVEELRRDYFNRIKKENPKLNAYLSVFDKNRGAGVRAHADGAGLLNGIPCAIKDNILIKGEKCTAGSKILSNYLSSYDAAVITKLKKAGAFFLGKTNLDEFAMGSSGENSAFGPTLNPHDHSRVAGGSSSGSAAAVAADLAVFALGSDTGGSIRNPASFCGVVGLKPTYGLVSRRGLMAMASSLDQIGPITKTVEDAAIVLNSIAGHDPGDSTSYSGLMPDYTKNLGDSIKGLKVGVPKEFLSSGLDRDVSDLVQGAIAKIQALGAHVDQVNLPMTDYALAVYYIIVSSEISANLARYDGVKYGYSIDQKPEVENRKQNLLDVYLETRGHGLGNEVKRRIMLGTYVLSAGYYDAYYLKAQKVRTLIKRSFDEVFSKFDIIAGPTVPTVAPRAGELSKPLSNYLADIYTVQANLAGLPAISVPCGFVPSGLPVGLQIIGNRLQENTILKVAFAYYGA